MSESIVGSPEPAAPPRRRGRPLVAWLVIAAAIGFILWRYATAGPIDRQRYDAIILRLQARYLVGLTMLQQKLSGSTSGGEVLYDEANKTLNRGPYPQRLRFIVLTGEWKGPDEALTQLHQLDERYRAVVGEPPAEEAETAQLLDHLFSVRKKDPPALADLPESEQQELRRRLGWFGDLALAPADEGDSAAREAVLQPAYRTALSLLTGIGILLLLGGLGLIFLVTLFVLWFLRMLHGGLTLGSGHGAVYAESFAVYMLLFLGLSYGAHALSDALSLRQGGLALSGLAALGSLAALAWPVLRGIPWKQVRQDIGWLPGRRPWLEPLLGLGCYAMALPLLFVGLLLLFGLTKLRDHLGHGPSEFGSSDTPGHPIVFWVQNARWWAWLQVLFVASVVAPIVEETMFRGVLYRHLREASAGLRPALSVLLSALVVSFVFAVIHPQGLLAVPALMALALAFTLMREWRGTLVPSMIAHAINNGMATLLMFFTMS